MTYIDTPQLSTEEMKKVKDPHSGHSPNHCEASIRQMMKEIVRVALQDYL